MKTAKSRIVSALALGILLVTQAALAGSSVVEGKDWNTVLPAGWTIQRPDNITTELWSGDRTALCGIHVGGTRFATSEEFAAFMMDFTKKGLMNQGLLQMQLSYEKVETKSGLGGIEALVDIVPGGRSKRLFFIDGTTGYSLDCETSTHLWQKHLPDFDQVLQSFDVK